MTTYRTLSSLTAMIRRVHSPRGRRRAGLFSIEGTRLLERAVRAGAPLEAVLVADRLAQSTDSRWRELLAALSAAGCPVTVAPDSVLAELTDGRDLGPILGLVRLPAPRLLAETLSSQPAGHAGLPLLLAAVDIVDPGNVGALTRTAHAAGAAALLAVGASDPYHPRATRISRGSIFKLPVVEYDSVGSFLRDLAACGVTLVGTAATGGLVLSRMAWPDSVTAILMGNEAEGLPAEVQAALDFNLTIPMREGVDSYSVNAAAAIILHMAAQSQNTGD
ncbi:MAG: RNA methyltransferase [Candidatus Promineofilum sp.]|nr:RNA methyltransferase [Promineifilum sp.]